MSPRILIVDDEPDVRLAFRLYLSRAGFEVFEADSVGQGRQSVVSRSHDGVILDLMLPDGNGLDWIGELRERNAGLAIVVMSGVGDVPTAVEAMRRGADHFLVKPVNMPELEVFLNKSLEMGGLRRRSQAQRRLSRRTDIFFGASAAAQQLRELASLAAQNDAPALLQGETGSGKGVLARWIHEHSTREGMPFVEVSCALLRGELLASELFGHARGAFTSAVADRQGLLDVADGGTLFLDEIGELDLTLQAQFLKVLEEKRYRRLGDVVERRSEFRLICATNRNLRQETEAGRFRRDLFFRVDVFPVDVPPLRTRLEDLPGLVGHLLTGLGAAGTVVAPAAVEVLARHPWEGNVRELRNALERALLVSRGGTLQTEHFAWLELAQAAADPLAEEQESRIRTAIRDSGGNVALAAQTLGMSRATLYRRLQRLRG